MQPSEFNEWFSTLTHLDQMNFLMLVQMKNGRDIIDRLDEGKYKIMALYIIDARDELVAELLG